MTEEKLGIAVLVEVGLSYVEGLYPTIDTQTYDQLAHTLESYLNDSRNFDYCNQMFLSILGRNDPLIHVKDIANLKDDPIPSTDGDPESMDEHNRKKTRTWSSYEDQRLVGGIYKFGLDNWSQVATFVGNNRTRAQCSQRWARGLNPRICKKHWSPEEDAHLIQLVHVYGEKAWTKIASFLGNRSDVQCRYHYRQITKDRPNTSNFLSLARRTPVSMSSGLLFGNVPNKFAYATPPSFVTHTQLDLQSTQSPVHYPPPFPSQIIGRPPDESFTPPTMGYPPTVPPSPPRPIPAKAESPPPQWEPEKEQADGLDSFLHHFKN